MSIKVMSKIWEAGPKLQSHRFVLLALADYANDDGECWPSINGIARKTCMTTRGVQKIMRHLEADGWVVVVPGAGRKNCNVYVIKTPNTVHPQEQPDPLNGVPGPLNVVPNTPEPGSPEPSVTVNRTIICKEANSKPKKERPRDALLDSLASLGGCNPKETPRSRWSSIAKCKRDLLEVCPDLSPQEIDRRAENYRTHFSGAAITPEALTKHWAVCATRNTRPMGQGTPVRYEPELQYAT